jgi:hypothetical protein
MSILILSCGTLFLVCLAVLVDAACYAPEGFEDETGFYLDEAAAENLPQPRASQIHSSLTAAVRR